MSNHQRSPAMLFLEQQLMLCPKSIPELAEINPEINWKSVVNNAVMLGYIRPNGDFFYNHRKHKRYEYVEGGSLFIDMQGEVPACFTPVMFAEWKQMARLAREPVTICEDCQQHTIEYARIVASGRCHQSIWSQRNFGNRGKELSNA
jgi:hypothetical protein